MKAFIILLLVFSILGGVGFGMFYDSHGPKSVYEIAETSKPTKVTTEVSYSTMEGDVLTGFYTTSVNGSDTVFEYEYQRLATPEESLADGNVNRIKTVNGVIYYHDGVYYSGDNTEWKPGTGTAVELKFDLSKKYIKDAEFNEDETVLTGKIAPEDAAKVLGTDLRAVDDILITVETNGINLTLITVSCLTQRGEMTIRTSYTYNTQDLFPEAE